MKIKEVTYLILTPEDEKHVLTDGKHLSQEVTILKELSENVMPKWTEIEVPQEKTETEQ